MKIRSISSHSVTHCLQQLAAASIALEASARAMLDTNDDEANTGLHLAASRIKHNAGEVLGLGASTRSARRLLIWANNEPASIATFENPDGEWLEDLAEARQRLFHWFENLKQSVMIHDWWGPVFQGSLSRVELNEFAQRVLDIDSGPANMASPRGSEQLRASAASVLVTFGDRSAFAMASENLVDADAVTESKKLEAYYRQLGLALPVLRDFLEAAKRSMEHSGASSWAPFSQLVAVRSAVMNFSAAFEATQPSLETTYKRIVELGRLVSQAVTEDAIGSLQPDLKSWFERAELQTKLIKGALVSNDRINLSTARQLVIAVNEFDTLRPSNLMALKEDDQLWLDYLSVDLPEAVAELDEALDLLEQQVSDGVWGLAWEATKASRIVEQLLAKGLHEVAFGDQSKEFNALQPHIELIVTIGDAYLLEAFPADALLNRYVAVIQTNLPAVARVAKEPDLVDAVSSSNLASERKLLAEAAQSAVAAIEKVQDAIVNAEPTLPGEYFPRALTGGIRQSHLNVRQSKSAVGVWSTRKSVQRGAP